MSDLTPEIVLRMEAGRQMDALVHELVMGGEPVGCVHTDAPYVDSALWWPFYSTRLVEAFSVLAALKEQPGEVCARLGFSIDSTSAEGTRGVSVSIGRRVAGAWVPADTESNEHETHELTALAICRAALLVHLARAETPETAVRP